MKSNAIPSVFDKTDDFIEVISNDIVDEFTSETASCSQCPCLLEKIKDLEHQIILLKTKYSVSIGKIEKKNADLKIENVEKKKQLETSEKEKTKLKFYLDDIRSQNFISDAERDFLNVTIFLYSSIFNMIIFRTYVQIF